MGCSELEAEVVRLQGVIQKTIDGIHRTKREVHLGADILTEYWLNLLDGYADTLTRHTRELAQLRGLESELREFVERERAVRDAISLGGQHTGYTPSISVTPLVRLEKMLAKL